MGNATRRQLGRSPQSLVAEAAFRQRLADLGAVLLEPEYLGAGRPHRAICGQGHPCNPRPADLKTGHGICRACVGRDPAVAEAAFIARLAELGAVLLEPYVNTKTKVHVRDAAGHDCYPSPGQVLAGHGVCAKCAGMDMADRDEEFRARLAAIGATPLYDVYLGANHPHLVQCAAGHECHPRPGGVRDGGGICLVCAGKCPRTAEAAFRARLEELGAIMLEQVWLGVDTPHAVQCSAAHIGHPSPSNVLQGHGICRICSGLSEWNAFYVVSSATAVKFGISTDDARKRLRVHAGQGFTDVLRLVLDLPGTAAHDTETAVRSALALAGEKPVRGREYFDISCLALILDVADGWLTSVVA